MFGDEDIGIATGRRDNDGGDGRDVEGLGRAAGAARIQHSGPCGKACGGHVLRVPPHDPGGAHQFIHGRLSSLDQREHGGDLRVVRIASKDPLECVFSL
jgi:hypothetical protein